MAIQYYTIHVMFSSIHFNKRFLTFSFLCRQFSSQSLQSLSEMKRGRGRFSKAASSVPVKTIDVPICVLPGPTVVTPKPAAELELAQAGLGKRIVQIPEDGTHAEALICS